MSVRISWRMTTAMIGPKTPPRPPARLTPPSTTAATPAACTGPGIGVADAGGGRRGSGRRGPRTGPSARRPRSSSGRPSRRSGTRRAGCCRSRRSTGPAATAGAGSRSRRRSRPARRSPWARSRRTTEPEHELLQPAAALPPGRVEHEQRAAGPHERHGQGHDDVRHPGDDDQAAVDRPERAARAAGPRARRGPPNSAVWPFISDAATTVRQGHHRADRQVDPAGDHDDRLADGRRARAAGPRSRGPGGPRRRSRG